MERILSIAAIIISLSALGLSFVQSYTIIKHNHVSLQPRLHAYFSNEEQNDKFGIYLVNNGLGPAYIKEFKVYLDNKILSETKFGYFQPLIDKLNLNQSCFAWGYLVKDSALDNRDDLLLIRAKNAGADECSVDKIGFFTNLKRIKIEIAFESIYGDKFTYTYNPS